jgi:hypothetical protein
MSARVRWISIIIAFLFANIVAMGFLVLASQREPAKVLTSK